MHTRLLGRSAHFGKQRLVRPDVPVAARLLYRTLGIADPAHWLHARYLTESVRRHLDAIPGRILDAGCGRGDYTFLFAQLFPDAEVVGIDIDAALVRRNVETSRLLDLTNTRFAVSDLAHADFGCRFGLIVCVDVLEHIASQTRALQNLACALEPGGLAFLHVPTVRPRPVVLSKRLGAFHRWAEDEHVADEITADEFCSRVQATGLEILDRRLTFGRYTGELATGIFALFFEDTGLNRVCQAVVSPLCRVLAMADRAGIDRTRYAVGVTARKPV